MKKLISEVKPTIGRAFNRRIRVKPGTIFTVQKTVIVGNTTFERGRHYVVLGTLCIRGIWYCHAILRNALNSNGVPRINARILQLPLANFESVVGKVRIDIPHFKNRITKRWIRIEQQMPSIQAKFFTVVQQKYVTGVQSA